MLSMAACVAIRFTWDYQRCSNRCHALCMTKPVGFGCAGYQQSIADVTPPTTSHIFSDVTRQRLPQNCVETNFECEKQSESSLIEDVESCISSELDTGLPDHRGATIKQSHIIFFTSSADSRVDLRQWALLPSWSCGDPRNLVIRRECSTKRSCWTRHVLVEHVHEVLLESLSKGSASTVS